MQHKILSLYYIIAFLYNNFLRWLCWDTCLSLALNLNLGKYLKDSACLNLHKNIKVLLYTPANLCTIVKTLKLKTHKTLTCKI